MQLLSFYSFAVVVTHLSFTLCSADNQFITLVNPNCSSKCDNGTLLVYSRLQRSADSLHVFVTVGEGLGDLAISYVQFNDPKQLAIVSWDAIFSSDPMERANALSFSNPKAKLMSKFTYVLTNLIEYSDMDDSVKIPVVPNNTTRVYPFGNFRWRVQQGPELLSNGLTQLILSTNSIIESPVPDVELPAIALESPGATSDESSVFQANSSNLQLRLQFSPTISRATDLPQLQFTSNNTQLELLLNNLLSSVQNARFAVETVLLDATLSSDGKQHQQEIEYVFNIDDEFTPGVFRMSNWLSRQSCYAQWKPVCYKAEQRTIGGSTVVGHTDLVQLSPSITEALNYSFVFALYGGNLTQFTGARASNVTFGLPKDKFYAATNYTVWTISVGLGDPPSDVVSTLVIIVILCGLGLPFLLMSSAAIYLCVRRCRQQTPDGAVSAYQPINA